jgi:uncharacterized membrane protein
MKKKLFLWTLLPAIFAGIGIYLEIPHIDILTTFVVSILFGVGFPLLIEGLFLHNNKRAPKSQWAFLYFTLATNISFVVMGYLMFNGTVSNIECVHQTISFFVCFNVPMIIYLIRLFQAKDERE